MKHFYQRNRALKTLSFLALLCAGLQILTVAGCGSTSRQSQKTLEVRDLTLIYRDKSDSGPEVAALNLQHPLNITEDQMTHILKSLRYENFALLGESGPVFTEKDIARLRRLLTKALNKANPRYVVAFELESEDGLTVGEVFAGDGYLHWRFDKIKGVSYSLTRNQVVRYGTAWRLKPSKGQRYFISSQLLGSKEWSNWIVMKLNPKRKQTTRQATSSPPQTPPPAASPAPTENSTAKPAVNPELEEKLRFLKELYEKQLIDKEEYEKKRSDLLNEYL